MTIRSRMSCVVVVIGPEHWELFALQLGKIAEFDFIYTPASTNINQSVPNLGQNEHHHKISDEFDYGCNQTRTVPSYLPLITKFVISDFVYTLASANIN